MKTKKIKTAWIAKVAILASISIVLYEFVAFPLPFLFPGFLKMQFSNLPLVIGGFLLGPGGGMAILGVRTVIAAFFSKTALVGELADFIIGVFYVLTTSLIYKKMKTKKGGLIALICGCVVWVISAALANYFILVPAYLTMFFKGSIEGFIATLEVIPVNITESNYRLMYTLFAAVPFNLLISVVVSVVTFFTYKRLSVLFSKLQDNDE